MRSVIIHAVFGEYEELLLAFGVQQEDDFLFLIEFTCLRNRLQFLLGYRFPVVERAIGPNERHPCLRYEVLPLLEN